MKYLIVGGVAGGATAAARLRRIDEKSEITIIEKGKYVSYANCGLPYYIGDVIEDRNRLFEQTPELFKAKYNIDVKVENEAIAIDPNNKTVTIRRCDESVYTESYDKLLLSPGAVPVIPQLKGIDYEGIFTLRNVNDTDAIKTYTDNHKINRAVVVGAGFIGLEMAENLHNLGAKVSIIEKDIQVMSSVDYSTASYLHQHLLHKGVSLHLDKSVEGFEKSGDIINVLISDGEKIEADIVILSIGVRPLTTLAESANIEIGETRGIRVNEYLETSVKDIYAIGDAIEFPHPITGQPWLNYLANPANRQGRIVADNMVKGNVTKYEGAIGTSVAKVFDMTVASTGVTTKKLNQLKIASQSIITHSSSHAGYYPGATQLTTKLVFNAETGQIYGAQCVGHDGVDKRIDQISVLIKNKSTVYDLAALEQAYAPPYSSAKDPIAIAGYAATNIIDDKLSIITWRDIDNLDPATTLLIDVRSAQEFAFGSIKGAKNIPITEIRNRLKEIPTDKQIIVFCAVGLRGYLAQRVLLQNNYNNVTNLSGGYKTYSTAKAPIVNIENDESINDIIEEQTIMEDNTPELKINACGLQCPGPVLKVKEAVDSLKSGERVEITATDAGFARDAKAWCNTTGNNFIKSKEDKGKYTVVIEKGTKQERDKVQNVCHQGKGKTFIMFSDDLDKALATFVLANGAAATGEKTTIFFTFWGLNIIKKVSKPKVKKDIFGKMFGMMLPSDSTKLNLSKMSMLGAGDKMMRHIMAKKSIDSLEVLREQALKNGVEFIACQMSMDVMGVKREELLDEVTIGGVATYMERADNANVNLFI